MNIKGDYSGLTSYSVGDVVRLEDVIYKLNKPCAAGTSPTNTLYWERMPQPLADCVELIMDAIDVSESGALTGKVANNLTTTAQGKVLDARQGKKLKDMLDLVNPDSKTLVLDSSTASSTKKFAITVDDDGELTATEIEEAT
jgi:hypothetical protein